MSVGSALVGAAIGAVVVYLLLRQWRLAQRAELLRAYTLPMGLFAALRKRRPGLDAKDCQLASRALRQFFLAYLHGGSKFVSMPSQLADELWHEFILHTRAYEKFCKQAFGGLLHHTPATALGSNRQHNAGLRRCFWYACKDEQIDPRRPTRLPLLFALDAKLGIAGGFQYALDCHLLRDQATASGGAVNCAGDFSDSSIDGSTDGFGDGDGDAGGDGDGGGDSGCGGGCGGGD